MNPKRQNLDGVNQSIWSDHSIDPKEWTDNLTTFLGVSHFGIQGVVVSQFDHHANQLTPHHLLSLIET
jgi:hypothetical protein